MSAMAKVNGHPVYKSGEKEIRFNSNSRIWSVYASTASVQPLCKTTGLDIRLWEGEVTAGHIPATEAVYDCPAGSQFAELATTA